ncbi:MAG: NAD(P)/FAD-dependent oxidoreductase [Chthoniobacterales bacterium]|nr:NAD(P)/FAD-dependent oxidoreductase [Chthoniobacterales bacterium]
MVIIVGAGLAGLACAIRLQEAGVEWLLLESDDHPGGRVATEITPEGYRLDRGFQVLLDSYPTASSLLDLKALQPRYFQSGALMVGEEGWERILNPLHHPDWLLSAPLIRSFSLREKISLGLLASLQCLRSDDSLLGQESGISALQEISRFGLEGDVLEKFLRPFFAGVFLDNDLGTDASILRYDLKKFALGRALLPANGMGEIPRQLASRLASSRQRYGARVQALLRKDRAGDCVFGVELASGEKIEADHVILATDESTSCLLLSLKEQRAWSQVSTFYFTGNDPLYEGGLLVLPEGKNALVRHFTDLTNTAPEYAPKGKRLLSATVLNPPVGDLSGLVQKEINRYLPDFREWKFLQEIRIVRALPSQIPGFHRFQPERRPTPNLWLAGDQVAHASIDSALASGLRTADEVISCR